MTLSSRRTAIFTAVFIVLAGLAYWQMGDRSRRIKAEKPEFLFPGFEPRQVRRISISQAGKLRELFREGGEWFLAANGRKLPANQGMVETALTTLQQARRGDLITEDAQKHNLFQLDAAGLAVRISNTGNHTLANFTVGKAGPDPGSAYFKPGDSGEVRLSGENLRLFAQPDWIERRTLLFKSEEVSGISFITSAAKVSLERRYSQWQKTGAAPAGIESGQVQDLLTELAGLRALDYGEESEYARSGLQTPPLKVVLRLTDNRILELAVGQARDANTTYAQNADRRYFFLLPNPRLSLLKEKLREVFNQNLHSDANQN